jgi:hypothetical protein
VLAQVAFQLIGFVFEPADLLLNLLRLLPILGEYRVEKWQKLGGSVMGFFDMLLQRSHWRLSKHIHKGAFGYHGSSPLLMCKHF